MNFRIKNKIFFTTEIKEFQIKSNKIKFIINIKDNKSNIIIDNYELKVEKNEENTKFELELNNKLNILFPSQITYSIFLSTQHFRY